MIAHFSYVMCDHCGNPAEIADDAKGARVLAKKSGWKRVVLPETGERVDRCPSCYAMERKEQGL